VWNSAASQLETRAPGLTRFFDSSHGTLRGVSSPPVDDGTKHSGSRHASRRPRARIESGLACLKVGSQQVTHRPTSRPRFKSIGPRIGATRQKRDDAFSKTERVGGRAQLQQWSLKFSFSENIQETIPLQNLDKLKRK